MNTTTMTLTDWLIGIGAVILGVSILMLLVESGSAKLTRQDEAMRRHVNEEDVQ